MIMRRGFTLIELLVVISIISLLSSIVLGSINEARAKTRDAKRIQDILQVQKALELYAADHDGHYPPDPLGKPDVDGNPFPGVSCWECLNVPTWGSWIYDINRLFDLNPYIKIRPCDPLSTVNGNGSCVSSATTFRGYMYKSDSKLHGDSYAADYRLYLIDTMETGGTPNSLKYTGSFGNNRSIAVSSSDRSNSWSLLCSFGNGTDICQ